MNSMDSEIVMENMTWAEIRDAMQKGFTNVLFCVASIEQHGPHLPISTDNIFGDEIAKRVAVKLGNTLVAPTIRPGYSPHHMGFPGTITLRSATLGMVIEDYCVSLGKHRFKNIIVICSHGGNTPTIQLACREAAAKVPDTCKIIPIYDLSLYAPKDVYPKNGFHANRAETSEMLYIRGSVVRKDKIREDPLRLEKDMIDPSVLLVQGFVHELSSSGVLGDPSGANVEEGKKGFDKTIENLAKEIRQLL
jgi:creatinine amidohydrolase